MEKAGGKSNGKKLIVLWLQLLLHLLKILIIKRRYFFVKLGYISEIKIKIKRKKSFLERKIEQYWCIKNMLVVSRLISASVKEFVFVEIS